MGGLPGPKGSSGSTRPLRPRSATDRRNDANPLRETSASGNVTLGVRANITKVQVALPLVRCLGRLTRAVGNNVGDFPTPRYQRHATASHRPRLRSHADTTERG